MSRSVLCLCVVSVLVAGMVLTAWADAWGKRRSGVDAEENTDELDL
jgi:hypothetical protein